MGLLVSQRVQIEQQLLVPLRCSREDVCFDRSHRKRQFDLQSLSVSLAPIWRPEPCDRPSQSLPLRAEQAGCVVLPGALAAQQVGTGTMVPARPSCGSALWGLRYKGPASPAVPETPLDLLHPEL